MSSTSFATLLPGTGLIRPLIALNLWTFGMEAWMYATRIPAIDASKIKMNPYMSKAEFNSHIPPHVQWKADNYNHLLEQPTQFYAVALALAVLGADDGLNVGLAWTYVVIRVVHSLVQATVNRIMLRFTFFALSSLVLLGLTGRAVSLVF